MRESYPTVAGDLIALRQVRKLWDVVRKLPLGYRWFNRSVAELSYLGISVCVMKDITGARPIA